MKIAEFLTKILPATSFPDNDLAAALGASGLKDVEIPDETISKFNAVYMTPDRAKNDPEIARAYKAKHWGHFADEIERDIKQIVAVLPDAIQTKYYSIPQDKANGVFDRLAVLKEGVSEVATKGTGEDVKAAAEKWRKSEKELREQITAAETRATKLAEEFATKETGIKIDYALRGKLVDMLPKLDPNLIKTQDQKDFIINSTIHGLQSKYLLEFDKDNSTAIKFLNKDRSAVFEGNTEVTLDKFIEKSLEPYTVKNNGATSTPAAAKTAPVNVDVKSGRGTLHDLQLQAAQKAGAFV